jgi:DNA replication protein DnaC
MGLLFPIAPVVKLLHPKLPAQRTVYFHGPKLFRALQTAHADGSLASLFKKLSRASLLAAVSGKPYLDFLEIIDDRQGATLVTSQFPVEQWHDLIADATVADPRSLNPQRLPA